MDLIKFNPKAAGKIPREIIEVFNGDDENLKEVILRYVQSAKLRREVVLLEKKMGLF